MEKYVLVKQEVLEELLVLESTKKLKNIVPLHEKFALTVDEASAYTGVGRHKIAELAQNCRNDFVLHIGRKTLIKRELFEKYLEETYSI